MTDMETTTETATRLRRSITQLNRRLRASALGSVSPAQASMLGSIERAGRPTLGELATIEQVQPPSVTRIVRTLSDVGLVCLESDTEDRRMTRATLTAAGRRELATIRQRKTEFLVAKIESLSRSDQSLARDLVTLLERLLERS
jgi:DNA-binding MarR family transcriptional regulator